MEIIELIRNADTAPKVLSTLSTYIASLRHSAAIPEPLLRLPLEGAEDVAQRMAALIGVVDLASRNLRERDCGIARSALQVFAAATWRLRPRRRRELH